MKLHFFHIIIMLLFNTQLLPLNILTSISMDYYSFKTQLLPTRKQVRYFMGVEIFFMKGLNVKTLKLLIFDKKFRNQ